MAIEIVGLPIDSMVIFHSFLYVYQRVPCAWCIFIIFIRHDSRSFTSLIQKVDATSTHGGFYQHN